MGDIAAADVTARVRYYSDTLTYEAGQQGRMVRAEITIDLTGLGGAGTNKTYDTVVGGGGAGIPLTNLFTPGNASDLGFDPKYLISAGPAWAVEANATDDETLGARYIYGGQTAASQKIMLLWAGAAVANSMKEVTDGTDLDAAGCLPGATSVRIEMTFFGRKRL